MDGSKGKGHRKGAFVNPLQLVSLEQIPKETIDAPNDLILLFKTCIQMADLCLREKGIGLSAVQVGIPWRLFIILNNSKFEYYVNCEYTGNSEKSSSLEACLSIRQNNKLRHFRVERYKSIKVTGVQLVIEPELTLKPIDLVVDGMMAVVFQHEIDHQKNILISDIGMEIELR